jgi:hypothetical protein
MSKKQLDGGIAGSLFSDFDRLKETCIRAYPQLKASRNELQFAYKLDYAGLSEEQKKEINEVEPKAQEGWFAGVKNLFS